jgi:hypothetical protein
MPDAGILSAETTEIDQEKPKILLKLQSRRVQRHLRATLISIRRMNMQPGMVSRDARQSRGIHAIEWETLDLYTVAHDIAEEDDLRFLVSQARSMLLAELIRRSACPR